MNQQRIDEIKARCDKATAGPWIYCDTILHIYQGTEHGERIANAEIGQRKTQQKISDADFIAHSREDVLELLAEVERLTAENAEYVKRLQNEHAHCEKLADYEDTGLSPEEIVKLKKDYLDLQCQYEMYGGDEGITGMLEQLTALKSERDVAVRALEMACRVIRNEWYVMKSVQYVTDRYIQQAKENLQK
jgi:hypothetical protein